MPATVSLPDRPLASTPSLYVVATPLGNLHDMTLRALAVLGAVDVVAAEDPRHSQRLLDAYGLKVRMMAVHQHNEQAAAGQLIDHLAGGRQVALITDAGTPAVSDPGARLVARVREAGYAVVPLPGPCAAVAALSVSGFAEGGSASSVFCPPRAERGGRRCRRCAMSLTRWSSTRRRIASSSASRTWLKFSVANARS